MPRENNRRSATKKLSRTIMTPPFRMAFPALFTPEETDNGERYKVIALFPPDEDISEIEDALFDCMEDGFGKDKEDWPRGRNDVWPDAKLYPADEKKYNGFSKGWTALNLSSQDAPGVVGPDPKNDIVSKKDVYGGRWARAQITITWYDNKSKGVTAYLNHVQLLDHDEPFNGKGHAEDAFDKYKLKNPERKRPEVDEDDDDRNNRRERGRRDDQDDDDRGSRRRDGEDEGRSRNGRGNGRDDDRDSDRGSNRSRDDRGRSGRSARDDEEDTRSRRGRDDDREDSRSRRGRDDDEERPSRSRSRTEDDEPPRNSGRGSRGNRREMADAESEWN